MKKSLFAVVFILTLAMSASVFADTRFAKKGTWAVSGSGSWAYDLDAETNFINVAPAFSYFVMEGLSVGAILPSWTHMSMDNGAGGTTSVDTYGLAALVRYQYLLKGTLFLTGSVDIGYYGFSPEKGDGDGGLGFGIHAGPTISFGGKFGGYFGAYLGYDWRDDGAKASGGFVPFESKVGILTELGLFF